VVNPIQPNIRVTAQTMDTFPGQKLGKIQEVLVPVVGRKQEVSSAREEIPREEIEKAAEKLNRLMGIIDKHMKFVIDDKSHRVMVKIVDIKTGKVLNGIPSGRILDLLGCLTIWSGYSLINISREGE